MSDDEERVSQEILDMAGELFVERVYDRILAEVDDARTRRSWFFARVPKSADSIIQKVAPDLIAAAIMEIFDQIKFNEISVGGAMIRTSAILSDGREVVPSEYVDLNYESFGPEGLFAKHSKMRLPIVSEDP